MSDNLRRYRLHMGVVKAPLGNSGLSMSHLTEVFETVRKAAPVTSLFPSYMEPLCYVSRGKTGGRGTGKRDYRHRSWTGCV